MTDTAVRPPIAELMTSEALIVDIRRVRQQLQYLRAFDESKQEGIAEAVSGEPGTHLIAVWAALKEQAAQRNIDINI